MTGISTNNDILKLYEKMRLIRRVDEKIIQEYSNRNIRGPVHLSIGQEAIAVGVLMAGRPGDCCVATHRNHAQYLAKGGDLQAMVDELYGLESGCAKGFGGSMHLYDHRVNFWGSSAVVGGSLSISAGIALALKKNGHQDIAVCFAGDGATDEGVFFETLNLAALLELPLLIVIENNGLSTLTPLSKRQAVSDIAQKAGAMGVEATMIDGNDADLVYRVAGEAVASIRSRSKPYLIEAVTHRLCAHVGPVTYMTGAIGADEELSLKLDREPLTVFRKNHPESLDSCEAIDRRVDGLVDAAFERAKAAFQLADQKHRLPAPPPPQPNRV